jgi:hypothetical protein
VSSSRQEPSRSLRSATQRKRLFGGAYANRIASCAVHWVEHAVAGLVQQRPEYASWWARHGYTWVGMTTSGNKNISFLVETLSKLRFYGSSTLSTPPIR